MARMSIKGLSKLTGYSTTTVSMVLNGRADQYKIAKETQEKILATARKHSYTPNLHARNLRNKTSNILGLMLPTLTNRFFSEMAEMFELLSELDDKFALISVTHHDEEEEIKAVNYFISQNAECIFTANPMALDEVSKLCTRAGVKQVIMDAPEGAKNTVTTDNFNAARMLTHNILVSMEKCCPNKGIYYVGGMESHTVTRLRFEGFLKGLEEHGRSPSRDLFVPCEFNVESAYDTIAAFFESTKDIGGLFVNSLQTMEGLLLYFSETFADNPHIHLGVFDYHPFISFLDLNIISVMQDAGQMMHMAYELYVKSQKKGAGNKAYYIPHKIIYSKKAMGS